MSSFILKITALLTMMLDHSTHVLWMQGMLRDYELYLLLRGIGRLAFPIYAFLLVQGFSHTKDRKKYLSRLMAFALIAQIPFTLCFANANYLPVSPGAVQLELLYSWEALLLIIPLAVYIILRGADGFVPLLAAFLLLPGLGLSRGTVVLLDGEVNVFYTLSAALALMCCAERLKTAEGKDSEFLLLPAALLPILFIIQPHADYALRGIMLIFALYAFKDRLWAQVMTVLVWSAVQYAYDMSPAIAFVFVLAAVLIILPLKKKPWAMAVGVAIWALIANRLTGFSFSALMIFAGLSSILFIAYNGKPGKKLKMLFYAAYPIHLLLLYAIFTFL